jgi:hypothetical protein
MLGIDMNLVRKLFMDSAMNSPEHVDNAQESLTVLIRTG